MTAIISYLKTTLFSHRTITLSQWQEKSFVFVLVTICVAALPALINSCIRAVKDELWINLGVYIASYLLCVVITTFRQIPFKIRAWLGVLVLFSLGVLAVFSVGPLGSGRIWMFSASVFATLVLGINAGGAVLAAQMLVLIYFGHLLNMNFDTWANLSFYSKDLWVTTSITFMFLSIVSVVSMGRLIRGLARSLKRSRKFSEDLQKTGMQLRKRILAHKETIASLKESENRWHFALEGAGDGVWDWNHASGQIYFSSRWKKTLGYDKHEVGTAPEEWFDRIHPEDKPAVLRLLDEYFKDKDKDNVLQFQSRYRLRCKDGAYKWFLDRGKIMEWDDGGKPLRTIGTHADITEIKALEDQRLEYESRIQQMQKMEAIGTLAGGIAHDFNNILAPMIGYSEIIREELMDRPDLQENLDEVLQASFRAKDLVSQILAFSRQESQIVQPVRVQNILSECLRLLRASIPRTIQIESIIDKRCGMVVADSTKLHQVVMNLATNAFHSMELTGGTLWLIFEECLVEESSCPEAADIPPGRYGLLVVRDTGVGIEKECLDKIFQPYFTTKKKGKGTGLGLSVVHTIVEGFNGCITVHSRKGRGSEFCVYLPVMAKERFSAPADREMPIPRGNERILLVDDEKSVACMALQMLERLGYRVTMTTSSEDALKVFSRTPEAFDLLITDMTMPGMTGVELFTRARSVRPDVPVILCTGFSDHIDDEKARELNLNAYVLKPFSIRKIGWTIRTVLDE